MLQHAFEGLRVLSLGNCPVGFEDVLDGGVHIGLESEVYELVLHISRSTASFYRLRLHVIFRLVALMRYS